MKMTKYSFKRGYNKIPQGKVKEVREKIITALGISKPSFYSRLRGEVIPKITEYNAIEAIFQDYGIEDIWGEK